MSDFTSQIDGLPARDSGPWAKEKLDYVERYMSIFSRGMKNRFPERAFIDLMAGPGRCLDPRNGEEFPGSPVLALNCPEPFTHVVLVESDAVLAAALRERVGPIPKIIERDCNDRSAIHNIRAAVPSSALSLAFCDNLGMNIRLQTIADLTASRRVDLLVTFQVNDITRNGANVLAGRDSAIRWNDFFGGDGWRQVIADSQKRNDSPSETASALLEYYGRQLGTIGYDHVGHSHRTMKNSRGGSLYRLLVAGKHPKTLEFFDSISTIAPDGQRLLKGWE